MTAVACRTVTGKEPLTQSRVVQDSWQSGIGCLLRQKVHYVERGLLGCDAALHPHERKTVRPACVYMHS